MYIAVTSKAGLLMPRLGRNGLNVEEELDLTSRALTQIEWTALFEGLQKDKVILSANGEGEDALPLSALVDRVSKASDFKTPRKTLKVDFSSVSSEYIRVGEAFDEFTNISAANLDLPEFFQQETAKLLAQWNDVVETVKEIDAKLPLRITALQTAHNELVGEVVGISDKIERVGLMLGAQGSLFGGDDVCIWEAIGITVDSASSANYNTLATELKLGELITTHNATTEEEKTLKTWMKTQFDKVAIGLKCVFSGPTSLTAKIAALSASTSPSYPVNPFLSFEGKPNTGEAEALRPDVEDLTAKVNALLLREATAGHLTASDIGGDALHKRIADLEKRATGFSYSTGDKTFTSVDDTLNWVRGKKERQMLGFTSTYSPFLEEPRNRPSMQQTTSRMPSMRRS